MPVNLIISILSKLQFGKIKTPSIEIDKMEYLYIEPNQNKNIVAEKHDLNKKSSDKIISVYITDVNKQFNIQFYNIIHNTGSNFINIFNNKVNENNIIKRKNNIYLYFLVISAITVGIYYIYKYWKSIKTFISSFYNQIKTYIKYIIPFFKFVGQQSYNCFMILFNLIYDKINQIILNVYQSLNYKYDLIMSYFISFFDYIYEQVKSKINELIDIVSNIDIINTLIQFLNNTNFVFFTASFQQDNKRDSRFMSDNLSKLDKTENLKSIDKFDTLSDELITKYNNVETNNNSIDLTSDVNNAKNIIVTNKADDMMYINNKQIIIAQYNNIKTAINNINSSYVKEIDNFNLVINSNIQKWNNNKLLFV